MHSTAAPRLQSVLACMAVAVWSCAGASSAATIKGRVVDSSQRPIAGAEVRIWCKAETAGKRLENQLLLDGRAAALRTDDAGCFEVAGLPDLGQSICVVVQSEAAVVVSSHWIPAIGQDAMNIGDLTARRLTTVTGRVVDRQRSPVEGATVFNSGDAQQRVETVTDAAGAFRLAGVPEGNVCLFVERTGFRFSGELVEVAGRPVELTLTRNAESIEPLKTVAPLIPRVEAAALAQGVLQPFLDSLDQADDRSKTMGIFHLGFFDLMGSLERLDGLSFEDEEEKDRVREETIKELLDEPCADWAEMEALIESSSTAATKAACYSYAARVERPWKLPDRRAMLNAALLHARGIRDPKRRALELARIANEWFDLDLVPQARSLAGEALTTLEALPVSHRVSWDTTGTVAMAIARYDLPAARTLLDRIHYDSIHAYELGRLAYQAAERDSELAERLWIASGSRSSNQERPLRWRDAELSAPLCYRLARRDLVVARRVAERLDDESSRIAARGAIAQGVAETDEIAARSLLRQLFQNLPMTVSFDGGWNISHCEAAACCRLLPLAERLDPQFARECFWRVVALRPSPAADLLENETVHAHLYLIGMLARYDHQVAEQLLMPIAARLDEFVVAGSPAIVAAILSAMAAIDPDRAVERLARLPPATSPSAVQPTNMARLALVRVLGDIGHSRWRILGYSDPAFYDSW